MLSHNYRYFTMLRSRSRNAMQLWLQTSYSTRIDFNKWNKLNTVCKCFFYAYHIYNYFHNTELEEKNKYRYKTSYSAIVTEPNPKPSGRFC
jgi:hypothetical protein